MRNSGYAARHCCSSRSSLCCAPWPLPTFCFRDFSGLVQYKSSGTSISVSKPRMKQARSALRTRPRASGAMASMASQKQLTSKNHHASLHKYNFRNLPTIPSSTHTIHILALRPLTSPSIFTSSTNDAPGWTFYAYIPQILRHTSLITRGAAQPVPFLHYIRLNILWLG